MRRRIELYLGGSRADLPDDALVLFNWALTDVSNPTIVRNSFSQSFDLPRTAQNEAIFGHSGRLDRVAGIGGAGAAFNASRKLPFSLYADTGEILASGYAKLDEVTDDALSVSLYGGLGEFLWALSYDADGNKRTLASLDYLGGGDTELDFDITKDTVQEAWDILLNGKTTIQPLTTYTSSNLMTNGTIGSSSNTNRYVYEYAVDGGREYIIWARSTTTANSSAIVAYDSDGLVLQTWYDEAVNVNIQGLPFTMPEGAAMLRLQGYRGQQDAKLEVAVHMWEVINFAPAYNGIPDGDFDAGKAIADASDLGLTAPVTEDGTTYDVDANGYTVVTLADAVDEWAAKDLRSYLQRPVLNVWRLLSAIADPANNGGWSVDLSDIADTTKWPYKDAWLTRPLLPSLGTYKQTTGAVTASYVSGGWTSASNLGWYTLAGAPSGTKVTIKATVTISFQAPSTAPTLHSWKRVATAQGYRYDEQVLIIRAMGYASDNTLVAAGVTKLIYDAADFIPAQSVADRLGITGDVVAEKDGDYTYGGSSYKNTRSFQVEVSGTDIATCRIEVSSASIEVIQGFGYEVYRITYPTARPFNILYDGSTAVVPTAAAITGQSVTATETSSETLRSGSHITKQMLLSTEKTPADYLLAICKTFGLVLLTDPATRSVQVLRRKTFFVDETIDLTERVDRSKGTSITPLAFDAKWYDFRHEAVGGAFEKEYAAAEGVQYGIQRVDTGYDFDAASKNLLDGVALKSCAAVLDRSRYWYAITGAGSTFIPSPLLDPGGKYTLWSTGGDTIDLDLPTVSAAATIAPYNNDSPGYDVAHRAEFRDAKNDPVDGADVLLFYAAAHNLQHFNITDDLPIMDSAVGTPCWFFGSNAPGVDVPQFTRYLTDIPPGSQRSEVLSSLDFGVPRQMDIPQTDYPVGTTIYERAWGDYIRDRLSVHGKVLRCRVLLDGLTPGPGLLRRFFWYRGSLWVLNKISNYSLTTFDAAECEFIQVRDKDAYIDNQY